MGVPHVGYDGAPRSGAGMKKPGRRFRLRADKVACVFREKRTTKNRGGFPPAVLDCELFIALPASWSQPIFGKSEKKNRGASLRPRFLTMN